jgi:hypothetical protein
VDARLQGYLAALRRRALASRMLLFIFLLACLAWIGESGTLLWLTPDLSAPVNALIRGVAAALGLTSVAWLVLALLALPAVLLWLYRAQANLRVVGLEGLNYSPGWSVGCFFVPIVNLVVPFRAMRELYNRSFGEEAHFAAGSVPDVSSWWSCFLVGALVQTFLLAMVLIDALTPIYFTTPMIANGLLSIFAVSLLGGAAFFLQRIIGKVTRAQSSLTGIGDTFA